MRHSELRVHAGAGAWGELRRGLSYWIDLSRSIGDADAMHGGALLRRGGVVGGIGAMRSRILLLERRWRCWRRGTEARRELPGAGAVPSRILLPGGNG